MKILTARQQNMLDAIRHYLVAHGRPPTRAELAQSLGFRSANAAEQHLRALVRKGYIELLPGSNRNIRLLEEPVQPSGLALVGRIAAGRPMLAQEHIETRYQIDPQLFQPHADYLLRVRGMSMRDAGILEDDLLAVHRTAEAASGQVVVARLNDELTVKRIEFDNGQLRLRPENPEFMAIEIDPVRDNLVIEGIVVGIIRNGRL